MMSKDYKTIHNGDRLTDECRTLANSMDSSHGSIWESEEMANDILGRSGYRLCEKCCTIMIIENYD